jgi:hypothetical protein
MFSVWGILLNENGKGMRIVKEEWRKKLLQKRGPGVKAGEMFLPMHRLRNPPAV